MALTVQADWVSEFPATRDDPAALQRFADQHPVAIDWLRQDGGLDPAAWHAAGAMARLAAKVVGELAELSPAYAAEHDALRQAKGAGDEGEALRRYAKACAARRELRLATLRTTAPRFAFTRHRTIRPSFFAYTEGQSDAQAERHFLPGSSLCTMELAATGVVVRTLLEDKTGAIRDPAVSWDGKRVLFAWKKSLNEDDYHLYEMDVASGSTRQLTQGRGVADYEGAYLPDGGIVFSSTRCVQTVDCFWTEASNLYTCDADGRYLRRLSFDQVHAVYPTVADDGRVLYTRWDYNDRGQVFPQPLFQMNPDGTSQQAFYGENSWFPTTIAHARGIPGSRKVVAILTGHHASQAGKLAVIDPAAGRQENAGVQLVAPVRPTKAERIDGYGQQGELFQYPWPLNEEEFVVAYAPLGWEQKEKRKGDADFGIYWMHADGRRELLVSDPELPCNQPVALVARRAPEVRPSRVDGHQKTGTLYVQDIHIGPGLKDVPRGTIRKLRVVALDFRAAGIGDNHSGGPGGGALISTPVSIGNGTWDVKTVLGDATVHPDGSAYFTVPARTPIYLQALDERGRAVQTMRSWTTLQPGERQTCVGCHESKNSAPPHDGPAATRALMAGPEKLIPFQGPPRGFSFAREVQPILDRHCVGCHNDRGQRPPRDGQMASLAQLQSATNRSFSLLGEVTPDTGAKRSWSDAYLALTQSAPERKDPAPMFFRGEIAGRWTRWIGSQSVPEMIPPYFAGAARSPLMDLLESGHGGRKLERAELERIACWIDLLVPYCGDYLEANLWSPQEAEKYQRYLAKRRALEDEERRNFTAWTEATAVSAFAHSGKADRKDSP